MTEIWRLEVIYGFIAHPEFVDHFRIWESLVSDTSIAIVFHLNQLSFRLYRPSPIWRHIRLDDVTLHGFGTASLSESFHE
jgi:hypothetical protein